MIKKSTRSPLPTRSVRRYGSPVAVIGLAAAAVAASALYMAGAASAAPPPSCTRDISGTYSGSLVVTEGVVCIHDAHVTGSVLVTGPATVAVSNSNVDGAISTSKAALVVVCGTVSKSISVAATAGNVTVGYTTSHCRGNLVSGSIALTGNRGSIDATHNRYTGVITSTANRGAPITISDNTKIAM